MFNSFFHFIVIVVLGRLTAAASAQSPETVIPLEGLDPVMLSQGKEVQGDMKYKVTRGRFQYLFANEENKATFEKDPSKYEIQLNGHCARMGAPTAGNPDLYASTTGASTSLDQRNAKRFSKPLPRSIWKFRPHPNHRPPPR